MLPESCAPPQWWHELQQTWTLDSTLPGVSRIDIIIIIIIIITTIIIIDNHSHEPSSFFFQPGWRLDCRRMQWRRTWQGTCRGSDSLLGWREKLLQSSGGRMSLGWIWSWPCLGWTWRWRQSLDMKLTAIITLYRKAFHVQRGYCQAWTEAWYKTILDNVFG